MSYRLSLLVAVILAGGCSKAPAQTPPAASPSPAPAAAPATAAAPAAVPVKPVPAVLPAVVARVNGDAIDGSELDGAVKAVAARNGGPIPPNRRDEIVRAILDQIVSVRLLGQESAARNVTVADAEVDARVGDIRKQFPTEDAFKQALAAQGMTPERLPKEVRRSLIVNKMLEAEVKVDVQPAEIQKFYDQNLDKFKEDESVHASHILIRFSEKADEAAKKKAHDEAEAVLLQIKGGGDFATVAKAKSQDPGSAVKGGDLGFFHKGQMVPPFEAAAFALKPGEMSGVVESPFGYHIIKMTERKPGRTVPFAEVSDKIRQHLGQQQKQEKTNAFIQQLKAKGKVEILI